MRNMDYARIQCTVTCDEENCNESLIIKSINDQNITAQLRKLGWTRKLSNKNGWKDICDKH